MRSAVNAVENPMDEWRKWLAPMLACMAAPAAACPPPIPGQSEVQRLKPGFDASSDIVYGVVLKGARDGQMARFQVLHVYKGSFKPGSIIQAAPTYGFDPPPCLGMTQPPPPRVARGEYGVVAFDRRRPALNFVDRWTLDLAFKEGWIRSARAHVVESK